MKILVTYDGTIQSKDALKYGIRKVKEDGGELIALQVFNRAMFVDYDAGPYAEDAARREASGFAGEARALINAEGGDMRSRIITEDGDPEEETVRYAGNEGVDLIIATPRYKAVIKNAPCPVSIIPGNVLVPVDGSDISPAALERIIQEARYTGSKVLLLGLIPVHIYNQWEKAEMDRVKKETSAVLKKIMKSLKQNGIESTEMVRSGYPDEEILKAAGDFMVSVIMVPYGGGAPSELSKAASILLDEPDGPKRPVILMPSL